MTPFTTMSAFMNIAQGDRSCGRVPTAAGTGAPAGAGGAAKVGWTSVGTVSDGKVGACVGVTASGGVAGSAAGCAWRAGALIVPVATRPAIAADRTR